MENLPGKLEFVLFATLKGSTLSRDVIGKVAGGNRVNAHWAGKISGKLNGEMSGIDYAFARNDGVVIMDAKGVIVTNDKPAVSIGFTIQGFIPKDSKYMYDTNIIIETDNEKYKYLNEKIITGLGYTIDQDNYVFNYYYYPE